MMATVEISMYPLKDEYEEIVLDFIRQLKNNEELRIRVNPTATHIYGPYDTVMEEVTTAIKQSFDQHGKAVFAMKVLNGDLEDSLREVKI